MDIQLGSFIQEQAILLKDDFHVHVIYVQSNEGQEPMFDDIITDENEIDERIVYFKSAKGPFRKVKNAKRYKEAQERAFNSNNFNPSLCHVHVPYRSAFLALKLYKTGIPYVITEHWSGHLTGEFDKKIKADKGLYRQVLQKASGIATVSERLRAQFKKNTGFDSVVIPNYIKKSRIEITEKADDFINILSVSDLVNSIKNVSGLILAFKEALLQNPKLRLTIIGGGPDQEKIKELVTQLEFGNSLVLKGRMEHRMVLDAYPYCDFYVCNSNYETFGMTVAEALMAGKPVVSTRCGGPDEYLNEKNSILIESGDEEQLTNAILKMADSYASYDKESISTAIESKYGSEAVKQKLLSFYSKAINGTSS